MVSAVRDQRSRVAFISFAVLLAAAILALLVQTRYTVVDCPSGVINPPLERSGATRLMYPGCYVLDRWTGEVSFQERS